MTFARKMPEFYMIIFQKIFPTFWGGGGGGHAPCPHLLRLYVSGPPTSVLVIIINLMACDPLEIIVPRLCPGSEIFLAPPLLYTRI